MKKSEANIEDLRNQTVSWGTHRPDDLIPKFMAVLKEYGKEAYDKYVSENPEVEDWKKLDDETKGWVVDELFDLLDGIAPEDCYFGAHPGDGADFGFWQVDESKKNEEVIVDLTLPEAKKIYADVHKNHWDKSEFGKVMGSCLEYEDVSELIDYLIGVYDPGIRDRLDENDELMHLCFILLDEWREEHEPTESNKSESDTATAEQVFKDMADSLGISDRSVITTDGDRVKFVLKLKLKDLVDYAWEYNPKLKVVKNIASPTADAFDGARKTVNTVEDAAAWLRGGIEELLNMEKEAIDLVGNESKKSEAEGNKDIYTLDLTRIDAEGDEEGLDDMQAAQNFYDEDEAIQAAKDLADSYRDDDDVVQVTVMAGEQEKPNGDIVGEPFDIFTASSSDSATTAKYREKANYTVTDGLDYYAKGGKSESKKSMGRDQFIKDVLELADAEKQKYYRNELVSFAKSSYDHGETSVDKVLSDYFADTNESKKSEGEDDKGCKGKDCKDDKTKKNEADAPFKVGDFVTYDAASDGKEDFINEYVSAEIAEINDDGSLVLWIYDLDDGGNDVKDADPQFCTKLDHFAGKVDAGHYYMDGPYKAYKGGWEILITKKDLNPRVYEFIGTMDDLGEVLDVDAYYGGENFVYDQELEGAVEQQGWAADEMDYADMSGDLAKAVRDSDESKKSEGLPPKKLGNRMYRSRADLINKMKTLDAVEITTPAQFNDIHSKQWLHTAGYAMDINGNLVGQTYFGDKDGKWYYATTKTFQGDYLPECKEEAKKGENLEPSIDIRNRKNVELPEMDYLTLSRDINSSGYYKSSGGTYIVYVGGNRLGEFPDIAAAAEAGFVLKESKKSESLTLKQKELKNMARYGEATDITTISDAEAKELKKKGIETVGISRGAYGMNGALLRDNEGNKYVITARSSNLFYFV